MNASEVNTASKFSLPEGGTGSTTSSMTYAASYHGSTACKELLLACASMSAAVFKAVHCAGGHYCSLTTME